MRCEQSLSDAKNSPFRKMCDTLYRERQLWSGNESVEIRYVSGSSVAGSSASSSSVPCHLLIRYMKIEFSQGKIFEEQRCDFFKTAYLSTGLG